MANRLIPRVLFFIGDFAPTEAEMDEATQYGPGVQFRNVNFVTLDGALEDADAVAGLVPKRYADALPAAKDNEAIRKRMNPERSPAYAYDRLTDEQKAAQNANDLSRGNRAGDVLSRRAEPMMANERGWRSDINATPGTIGEATGVTGSTDRPEGWEPNPNTNAYAGNTPEAARNNTPIGGTVTPNFETATAASAEGEGPKTGSKPGEEPTGDRSAPEGQKDTSGATPSRSAPQASGAAWPDRKTDEAGGTSGGKGAAKSK